MENKNKKLKITNVDTKILLDFFNESTLYGDQTLDITKEKLYCKASNVTMSNITYREMMFGDGVVIDKDFPAHLRFFIQDYKILSSIVKSMNGEPKINLTFSFEDNICREMVFDNKSISFSIMSNEIGLSKYIDDDRFSAIKYPTDIVSRMVIKSSKISEIKSLHKLSKSDNEKMNLVFIYQMMNKLVIEHSSIKGNWKMDFESENVIEDTEKYALSLDIFDNIGNVTDLEFKVVNLTAGTRACYLTSKNVVESINISRIEKKEF